MSTRTILLLTIIACTCSALSFTGQSSRCLCRVLHDQLGVPRKFIKSLEVIRPSTSCDNLEIVVNLTNGRQRCLNPSSVKITEILRKLKQKRGISQGQ